MNRFTYQAHEFFHLALAPARALSDATSMMLKSPFNVMAGTPLSRNMAASAELFERMTRRYGKPKFGFDEVEVEGKIVPVVERVVWERPFCKLLHFSRDTSHLSAPQPTILIVAPISGHYATLLRGTVEAFLPDHEVYITDWVDARMAPLVLGPFDLDDYIDYLMDMCRHLGGELGVKHIHTLGVCQPAVPLIAAVALMDAQGEPHTPATMTLMGGPIDTRKSPTAVNQLAQKRGTKWFKNNCINTVPFPYPGAGRQVYPGFLQLSGFMAMNMDRHVNAHVDMFDHLVKGDGDSAEKHRDFYDEYLAVMDLSAEYYMQTIQQVFVEHQLPRGVMMHRDTLIDLTAIRRTGLLTVEGELDDISGVGQTFAANELCVNIPAAMKRHYVQEGVGHYGVFNGSRYRTQIAPRIKDFMAFVEAGSAAAPRLVAPAA